MANWTVPVYSQSSLALCWEACGRMMWYWRHKNLDGYSAKAGAYLNIKSGLGQTQLNRFYTTLGMKSVTNASGAKLRNYLGRSPVIFTLTNRVSGHALVAVRTPPDKYGVINPCAVEAVSFGEGTDSCTGGTVLLKRSDVDSTLGPYLWYW